MASVIRDPDDRKRIQFFNALGKRKTLRLGRFNVKQAEAIAAKVETIVQDQLAGRAHDPDVAKWLRDLDPRLVKRMHRTGLVTGTVRSMATLAEFLVEHFAALRVKSGTVTAYGHTRAYLYEFFGKDASLRGIGPAEAERFRQFLKSKGLAEATINRRIRIARQFFARAVRWKLIGDNPFSEVKAGSEKNKSRWFFVTEAAAQKVIDACPNAEWRLLFALSRYAGLRCPSEHQALTWDDVLWDQGKFFVRSSKTEHHVGGEGRWVPIFPRLRPYLLETFNAAEPGAKHVITEHRGSNANLRTRLNRIIKRAGLTPWPRLFQNLRSTCETELAEQHPIHRVCAWIGNSERVAMGHYLQITDEQFLEASMTDDEKAAQKAAQKAAHQPAPTGTNVRHDVSGNPGDAAENAVVGQGEGISTGRSRPRTTHVSPEKTGARQKSDARSGAVSREILRGSEARHGQVAHLTDEQRMRRAARLIAAGHREMVRAEHAGGVR